jgi:DNA-directed RNA polymerase specialized sigma24 family protein
MGLTDDDAEFEVFVAEARRRLLRALPAAVGIDATPDAVSTALEWAVGHRARLAELRNPHGYLYRIAVNHVRSATSREVPAVVLPEFAAPAGEGGPAFEPGLVPALRSLSTMQRETVWLVHACGWTYAETAAALEVSVSAVGTHLSRAMTNLRSELLGSGSV